VKEEEEEEEAALEASTRTILEVAERPPRSKRGSFRTKGLERKGRFGIAAESRGRRRARLPILLALPRRRAHVTASGLAGERDRVY